MTEYDDTHTIISEESKTLFEKGNTRSAKTTQQSKKERYRIRKSKMSVEKTTEIVVFENVFVPIQVSAPVSRVISGPR